MPGERSCQGHGSEGLQREVLLLFLSFLKIHIFKKYFLKGTSSKEVSWPGKVENMWYYHFAGFVLLFYWHLCNKSTQLLQI